MPVHLHPTPYGRPAHDLLHEVVAGIKDGDPLAAVTLLVPTNLCGTFARRSLAGLKADGVGVAALTVLTVDRLAELLGAPGLTAQGRRPATGPVLSAAWRTALAEDPGPFEPVAQHPATVQALVTAHRQLRELSPAAMEAVAASGRLTGEVVRLHRRVVDVLEPDYYDAVDLRAAAAAHLPGSPQLKALGAVVVFLPQDLPPSAAALVSVLADTLEVHVVGGLTGQRRPDAAVRTAVERTTGAVLPPASTPQPMATRVLHASDSDDEVRLVVREVVEALRTTPAHRVAVLYGSSVPYARLLHDHLSAADIELNGPGVRPTAERALPRALLTVLALAQDGVDRAGLFGLLAGTGVRQADGSFTPTARWERLSRRGRRRRTAGLAAQARALRRGAARTSGHRGRVRRTTPGGRRPLRGGRSLSRPAPPLRQRPAVTARRGTSGGWLVIAQPLGPRDVRRAVRRRAGPRPPPGGGPTGR